jgi:predicted amidohydrolase YtcJ
MHLMPAFIDAHAHFLGVGQASTLIDLSGAGSVDELVASLRKADMERIVIGRGWNQELFADRRMPTKADLDRVSPTVPVVAVRICGHALVANSAMLARAGIGPGFRHQGTGSASFDTGLFTEAAMDLIRGSYPPTTKSDIVRYLRNANRIFLSHGVTSVASDDFCVFPEIPVETIVDVFRECYEKDLIQVRIVEQANLPDMDRLHRFIAEGMAGLRFGHFRMGPLKLLSDGSLGARTAFLREPYADASDTRGTSIYDLHALSDLIAHADRHGMDSVVHAIGDGAVDLCLDAFEDVVARSVRTGRRNAIVHAQLADRAQITRMRALGIGAIVQPAFLASDLPMLATRLGARATESYLFGTMVREGLRVGISTDAPVESVDPFATVRAAVIRRSVQRPDLGTHLPEESLSVAEALRLYVDGNRHFSYEDDRNDEIGVTSDPLTTDPEHLCDIRVVRTSVEGRIVYEE